MIKVKECCKCKKMKPYSEFNKNKTRKDGYSSWCKECSKEYDKAYYSKNKKKRKAQIKRWREVKKDDSLFNLKIRLSKQQGVRIDVDIDELCKMFLDNSFCEYCGIELDETTVSIDHKTPLSRGGSKTIENLAFCCIDCNHLKHTRTYDEFKEFLNEYMNRFNLIKK